MQCPLEIHYDVDLSNTIGTTRRTRGVVYAESVEDVQNLVKWAGVEKVQLYTVSTGKNWGYGSSQPVTDDCLVVNLSRMARITSFDANLGTITLEPGVTQGQLYEFIQQQHMDFLVPTTGAGPQTSIVGNALEKGYGITPYQDHMSAIISIEAVLPDGTFYRSALHDLGGYRSDGVFPWKIGPYLEGMFVQSNLGIVTRATIALARKPESVRQFMLFVDEERFEDVVRTIATLRRTYGSLIGGVNLMNRRRVLSMMDTHARWNKAGAMSEVELRKIAASKRVTAWVVMGALYGPDRVLSAVQSELKTMFKPLARKVVFLNRRKLAVANRILSMAPLPGLRLMVNKASQAFDILSGIPSQLALQLAYIKNPQAPSAHGLLNPDRDNCGLIWFAPLVPKDPALVRDFYIEVHRVCLKHDIDPFITLTSISERCFDSTIPIVFDLDNPQQKAQAYKCYDTLMQMCAQFGIFPYRMSIEHIPQYFNNTDIPAIELYEKIKHAIDPANIFSPGRYAKH